MFNFEIIFKVLIPSRVTRGDSGVSVDHLNFIFFSVV